MHQIKVSTKIFIYSHFWNCSCCKIEIKKVSEFHLDAKITEQNNDIVLWPKYCVNITSPRDVLCHADMFLLHSVSEAGTRRQPQLSQLLQLFHSLIICIGLP